MAYIGNTPTTQAFTPAVDYFSGNGSTTAFTLSRPVASVAQVQVVVNNVPQNPSTAYTVSSNTITFTGAPSTGTNNIYVEYTSPVTQVVQPGSGTVGITQFNATGTPSSSTFLRGDNSWATVTSAFTGIGGQVFTSSGTFTVPAGVTAVKATVIGAGGGGGGTASGNSACGGGGGGGGGTSYVYVTGLTAGGTVTVTVGTAGTGGSGGAGGAGGTSSFGAYASSTGGGGGGYGTASASPSGGAGGAGSSGSLNLTGGSGGSGLGSYSLAGPGGGTSSSALPPFLYNACSIPTTGYAGTGLFGSGGNTFLTVGTNGVAGTGYGNGGSGACNNTTSARPGGAGSGGIVIVEW
jgi:hypothetical protein